jgi:hypothetical protein
MVYIFESCFISLILLDTVFEFVQAGGSLWLLLEVRA